MSRERLTWSDRAASPLFSKGRRASGKPALPNEGFGHPAGYEDPDMHKYETGDPSSWAEDPYEGEIRTSPAPAIPVDDGDYRHPATLEGSPMRNASLYKKAALRVRLAELLFKGKNSKIANDDELSSTFVQHQATELMDVPDDIITAAIRRIEAATLSEATLARKLYAEENGEDPSEVEEEEEEDTVAAKKAAYHRALSNTSSKRAALRKLAEEEEEEEEVEASKKASRIARLRQLIAEDEEVKEDDSVASKKAAKLRKLIAEEQEKEDAKEEEAKTAARRQASLKRLAQARKAEETKEEEKVEEKEESTKEAAQRVASLRKLLAAEEAKLKAATQKKAFNPMAEIASLRAELEAMKSGGRHAEVSTAIAEVSDDALLDETLAEFGLEAEGMMGEEMMGEEMMGEEMMGEVDVMAEGHMADDYSDIIIGDGADQMGFSDPSMTDEDDELLGSLFASKNASQEEEEEEEKEATKKASTQRAANVRTAALRPQPKKQSMTRTASAQGVSHELANLWDSPPSLEAVLGSMPTTKMNRR